MRSAIALVVRVDRAGELPGLPESAGLATRVRRKNAKPVLRVLDRGSHDRRERQRSVVLVKLEQAGEGARDAYDRVPIVGSGSGGLIVVPRCLCSPVDAVKGAVRRAHQDLVPSADAVHGGLHHGDRETGSHGGVCRVPPQLQHSYTGVCGERMCGRDHAGFGSTRLPHALAVYRRGQRDQKCEENAGECAKPTRTHKAPHQAAMSIEAIE